MRIRKYTRKDEKKIVRQSAEIEPLNRDLTPLDEETPINKYYLNVSRVFHIAEYVFIAAALLFALTFIMANPEIISYRNLVSIVSELSTVQTDYRQYSKLTYATETPEKSVLFGGGIAVLGEDNVFMFSSTGRFAYSQAHELSEPFISAAGKYAVVYGFGSEKFRVYSAFGRVHSGSTDYPIFGCSMSENGNIVFIESLTSGGTRVSLYNPSFAEVGYIDIPGYAVKAAVDGEGRVYVLSVSAGVDTATVFKAYDMQKGEILAENRFEDSFPVDCVVTQNLKTVVILNNRSVILNDDFTVSVEITHENPLSIACNQDSFAIASENELTVFDDDGIVLKKFRLNALPESVSLSDNSVFVLSQQKVAKYEIGSDSAPEIVETYVDVVKISASSDNHIIAFGMSGASLINY